MSLGKRFLASPFARAVAGVVARFGRWLGFGATLLVHDRSLDEWLRGRRPAVFVCWHQDFAWTMGYLSRFAARRPVHVLASASRDGGLAAAAAEAVGFREAVRGSSAAKGASALLRLTRLGRARGAASLAVVGDGPRPPARDLRPGAIHLARETGAPIWLLRTSWWPDPSMPRTWARFHFPGVGATGVMLADGPIRVPPDLDRDGVERLRVELSRRLNDLAARADAWAARRWGPGSRA